MSEKLVSVLISNHLHDRLEEIFHDLFTSRVSAGIEVIYIDDTIDRRTWAVVSAYIDRYPSQITASRNKVPLGVRRNQINLLRMTTSKMYAIVPQYKNFKMESLLDEIDRYINEEERTGVAVVDRHFLRPKPPNTFTETVATQIPKPNIHYSRAGATPLVCVTVHNYNHGRFLAQCLESVAHQTYENIHIIFSDNASDDDSWIIANNFFERYPKKFTITRNRINMGSKFNIQNCEYHVTGDYLLQLCSDDYLIPNCIEKCIRAFQKHPDAGLMIFHRHIVDAFGKSTIEAPFFDRSFKSPPGSIAEIYLMSSINPTISQVIYNLRFKLPLHDMTLIDRWFEHRIRDFIVSIEHPTLYCNEALVYHRIHGKNDSLHAAKNMLEIIGPYVANIEFELIAKERQKSLKNTGEWAIKLSSLSLRYASRALFSDDKELAEKYLHLSAAIAPSSLKSSTYAFLQKALYGSQEDATVAVEALKELQGLLSRSISYEPPEGSHPF